MRVDERGEHGIDMRLVQAPQAGAPVAASTAGPAFREILRGSAARDPGSPGRLFIAAPVRSVCVTTRHSHAMPGDGDDKARELRAFGATSGIPATAHFSRAVIPTNSGTACHKGTCLFRFLVFAARRPVLLHPVRHGFACGRRHAFAAAPPCRTARGPGDCRPRPPNKSGNARRMAASSRRSSSRRDFAPSLAKRCSSSRVKSATHNLH